MNHKEIAKKIQESDHILITQFGKKTHTGLDTTIYNLKEDSIENLTSLGFKTLDFYASEESTKIILTTKHNKKLSIEDPIESMIFEFKNFTVVTDNTVDGTKVYDRYGNELTLICDLSISVGDAETITKCNMTFC